MTMMNVEMLDALEAAGAPPDKARAAAISVVSAETLSEQMTAGFAAADAAWDKRFGTLAAQMAAGFAAADRRFIALETKIDVGFANVAGEFKRVDGDIKLLHWMVAAGTGLLVVLALKTFLPYWH